MNLGVTVQSWTVHYAARSQAVQEKLVRQAETDPQRRQSLRKSGRMLPKPPRNPGRKCMRKPPLETPKR